MTISQTDIPQDIQDLVQAHDEESWIEWLKTVTVIIDAADEFERASEEYLSASEAYQRNFRKTPNPNDFVEACARKVAAANRLREAVRIHRSNSP